MVKLMAMHAVPSLKDKRICVTENNCPHVAMIVIVVRVLGVDPLGHRRECVPFVETGESCGGFTPPEYQRRCAPDHECLQLDFLLADAPGRCYPTCTDEIRSSWRALPVAAAFAVHLVKPVVDSPDFKCTDNQLCLDVPNDGCDPALGGSDCGWAMF